MLSLGYAISGRTGTESFCRNIGPWIGVTGKLGCSRLNESERIKKINILIKF